MARLVLFLRIWFGFTWYPRTKLADSVISKIIEHGHIESLYPYNDTCYLTIRHKAVLYYVKVSNFPDEALSKVLCDEHGQLRLIYNYTLPHRLITYKFFKWILIHNSKIYKDVMMYSEAQRNGTTFNLETMNKLLK